MYILLFASALIPPFLLRGVAVGLLRRWIMMEASAFCIPCREQLVLKIRRNNTRFMCGRVGDKKSNSIGGRPPCVPSASSTTPRRTLPASFFLEAAAHFRKLACPGGRDTNPPVAYGLGNHDTH